MLTLVILSAGKGSRFGGNKSLQPVGPNDECLFYYAVYDAIRAGFTHCVFVVNEQTEQTLILQQLKRFHSDIHVSFAIQTLEYGIQKQKVRTRNQRRKPWGTAHAILSARYLINSPFAVINADDFYGRETYALIADDIQKNRGSDSYAVIPGYPLGNTTTDSGTVNRGLCTVDDKGFLQSIVEVHGIYKDNRDNWHSDAPNSLPPLDSNNIVSMTFWGFQTSFFPLIEEQWHAFLQSNATSPDAEFYIPDVVNQAIKNNQLELRVLHTPESWIGMTYKQDIINVREKLADLCQKGIYTPSL